MYLEGHFSDSWLTTPQTTDVLSLVVRLVLGGCYFVIVSERYIKRSSLVGTSRMRKRYDVFVG